MAIADVLAEQVKHLDADVIQVDEANLPGHPDEWEWAADGDEPRAATPCQAPQRRCTCVSATTAGSRSRRATWGKLMDYLNALHVDHIVMENAHRPPEELARVQGSAPRDRLRARRRGHQATEIESRGRIARAIERGEKVLGGGRVKYIHPDCGFWMLKRNIADGKIRALVSGRNLHQGSLA